MNGMRRYLSAGFTLLEMLAAMAMAGVLAGAMYASLTIGFGARRNSEKALLPVRAASIAFNIIGRDLASALPPRGILAGPFLGEEDRMSFFTRLANTPDAAPGIAAVEYFLIPGENGEAADIFRSMRINLLSLEETEPVEEKVSYGVNSLSFSYFDGIAWFDAWDSTTQGDVLPYAVDVSMELNFPTGVQGEEEQHAFRRIFLLTCAGSERAVADGGGI